MDIRSPLDNARQDSRAGAFASRAVRRAVVELHRARILGHAGAAADGARRGRLQRRGGRLGARQGSVRLFVFARHGESTANVAGIVSSDPARRVGLTARGRAQARQLGAQLAGLHIDLAVCSSFLRTQETAAVALRGRRIQMLIDRGFDEVRAGDFDGEPMQAYWSWEQRHAPSDRFPRGESVDEALLRYAEALRRLLSGTETVTLLVVHEFALRRIVVAATTPSSLSYARFGNALAYLFDERAIERAAAGLEESAQSDLAAHGQTRAMTFEPQGMSPSAVGGALPCR